MKDIYLYGQSDDLREIETDFDSGFEAYADIKINDVTAHYGYDGDWSIALIGTIPDTWIVRALRGNARWDFCQKYQPNVGQFIHIQVPDDEKITYTEVPE